MPDHLDTCLSVRELARRWRCRPSTVRGMVRCGLLSAIQIGGRVRVAPEAIALAEQGPLAVKPKVRRREKIDPEVFELLA